MQACSLCRQAAASVPAAARRPAGHGSGAPAPTRRPKRWLGARRAQLPLPRSLLIASLELVLAVAAIIITLGTDSALAVLSNRMNVAKPRAGGHGTRDSIVVTSPRCRGLSRQHHTQRCQSNGCQPGQNQEPHTL